MRFHVGFSKFVKPGKLLKWLGIGFLFLLSLASCESVHADTLDHFDLTNATLSSQYGYVMSTSLNNQIDVIDQPLYYQAMILGNNSIMTLDLRNDSLGTNDLLGMSYVNRSTNAIGNPMRIFKEVYFRFSNENFCDKSSYKSNDIYVDVMYWLDSYSSDFMSSNNFTLGDIWDLKFNAIDSNGDYYVTNCTYSTYRNGLNSGYKVATYYCPNTFIGNINIDIVNYSFDIFNKLSQDGSYSGGSGGWNYFNTNLRIDMTNTSYQCTSDTPVVDFTTGDLSDPETEIDWPKLNTGLDNGLRNPYSGFDFSPMEIDLPQNVQELLSLPLYVVDSVIRNSTTCTPYEIDFSPIVKKWGDSNGSYTLTLPCMRSYLSDLLSTPNFSLYNLIDVLLAAIVFYNLALYVIQFIDAITSGVDLYTWYFTRSDRKDGHKINHATGEVG